VLIRTSKSQMRFSRRSLLLAIGAGAALLPMIEADPADAAQCYVGGIKRLFVFGWCNGMLSNVSNWASAGTTPAAWQVASFQSVAPSGKSLLAGMPAKSLADYQSDLMLLHGVDYDFITEQPNPNGGETNGHACFPGMLTGSNYQSLVKGTSDDLAGGVSIDQYIASQMVASGYQGIPSLSLGVFVKSTGHLSWKGAGQVVLPNDNPYNVFATYFAGKLPTNYGDDAGAPAPAPSAGTSPTAKSQAVGKSILDYVLADLNRFSNTVGSADKITIQNHMQSVRDMEQTLAGIGTVGLTSDGGAATTGSGGCGTAAVAATSASSGTLDIANTSNIPTLLKLQFDMSAAAFAADMTRVIVCQCGDQGDANLILSWLGFPTDGPPLASDPNTGNTNGYHALAHQNSTDKMMCDTWFQQQLAYMIGNMKSVTDPNGASILDSSLFLAMNNMRTGTHETTTVPVVMAGSLGGYFKTGQSLALSGVSNNRLLLSILNGFGYPLTTFGTGKYCTGGPLTQLNA
jgi:hypothetical protein